MSNTNISIQLSNDEMVELAIKAIAEITGEEATKLANKTPDEIFQYLSFLLKCKKEKLMELLKEHDQNKELDFVSLAKMWRLVNKGKVPAKKREFQALDQEAYRYLKILFARRGDEARYRADNNLGSATSDVNFSSIKAEDLNRKTPIVKGESLKVILDKLIDKSKVTLIQNAAISNSTGRN